MKLRSMVKTPLMVISHKNASIIHKQQSAGRQVRVVESSQDPSKKLLFTPGIKKTKVSTIDTHSKKTSTQSVKMSKIKHSAAKRIPALKRAGRGKKSQSINTKLAAANVLLTDLDSIISPTVTKNNRYKVVKAVQKSVEQKPVILSNVKPTSKTSLSPAGEVFKSVFTLINEIDSNKIGKKLAIAKLPVPQTKKRQSVVTKQPELYSNVVSVNSTSNFTATVFRKQLFQETQIQGNFSDKTKTSNASFRFERTEKKEQNDNKIPKQIQSVSQNMNYVAPKNSEALRHTKTSVSNKINANKSLELKKSAVVKGTITENKAPQSTTIKARNHTRFMLQNKQTRNKPEKRKATRKSQVAKVGATTKFGRKQTKLLVRKHTGAVSVVRNSRPLRSSSQKSPQFSKKQIPRTSSVAKKSKNRGDADEKKTAVVEVSENPLDIRKRLQKMAKKTRPVNKLSSFLTLKSSQTGKEDQFAGLTKTTAKKSVVRKQRKLASEDHLLQNKSLRALKQYAPLLAIEVTPIQSLVKRSPKSATSSPTIVSSLCKAAKQTTLSQSKKNKDLNQREIMLPSENVSRQSYSSKFTSTPILAYSSYRTEKTSPLPTRKNVTRQLRKKYATKQTKKNTVAAKMKKLFFKDKTVSDLSIRKNKYKLTQRKDMGKTRAAYSKTSVSVEYVLSPKQSAKKRNNSLISSVMNEASKFHHYTVGKNFYKPTSEVKVKKLHVPVLAKTVYNKSGKMHKRLQNNSINTPLRKNLRSSHHLNKDMKLTPTHKKKSVSYAVKRTQKQYQSKQKIKPKSKSYLQGTCNRPLRSPKNIPSIAAKVTSSQKSHKLSGNSSQAENQNELLQRKGNLKIYSSLSSSAKKKNASLSNISISARSAAEPVSQLTNVTDLALPSSIRKGVQRVSAVGKKISRRSEDGKKRKPVTHARNVKRLSHINIEDNLELIKNVLSRAKLSKKSLSSVLNRSPKDFSRRGKSLISLRKRKPSLLGNVVKKPALRRAGKRVSLAAVSVKTVAKNKKGNKTHSTYSVGKKHAAKFRVSNIHSDKNTQLVVKPKGRKPSSPAKQIIGTARIAKDAKFNLSHPEQMKVLKTASRQKVTEISFELQKLRNLPKPSKASNLIQSKTLPIKKSGKLSTKADKGKSLTGMTTSLVKATEVQGNTVVIPRQTKTIKPKTLINKVQQAVSSPSQKKIITQSKEKVTKEVRGKMFVSKNSPKLSTRGIKKSVRLTTRERRSLERVAKVEITNWLTPEQNKALRLPRTTPSQKARYVVSSQNLTAAKISVSKEHLKLPKIIEGRKSTSQSQKQTRSAKTTESEKINLVSQGQKKASEPSAVGYKIQRTKSSTLSKKMGKNKPNKVTNNIQLNKVNSNLSKQAKTTKLIVPSASMIRLGKSKEIERIGLVTLGQKKTQEAPSHGGCKIAITKSSTLAKKKGKKALNKNKIIGKKLSHDVSLDRVKMRTTILSLPKIKGDGKAKEIDNISLIFPGENEESELSLSGYKMQKTKSSLAQKKTRRKKTTRKIDGEILSKQLTPKLSIKRTSVTSSPNISRSIKAKQISVISSEQDEAPKPLAGKYNTQKTKIFSPSKKAGKKRKAINEKSKTLSRKVNPKIATKMKRIKSVAVSPKITRLGRSKGIKEFLLASSGNKKALKLSPRGCKTRKTKLSAIPKGKEKKKSVKKTVDASISSPTTGRSTSNKRRTYIRYSLVPQRLKGTSKQLSDRQKNKKRKFTDVPKSASLGIMPDVLAHTRGVKSTKGISIVSFQKTHRVYTLNKSHRKSQPSRNISTVLPFNLVNEYASSETSPSQLKRTTLMKTNIIYDRQAQHISSPIRKTTQASPVKLQHVNEELGRRSLLSSDSSLEWKMTLPLDAEIAGSSYRRKDKVSLFPETARAESYICNVSYTRNDREDQLPVNRTTESPQTLTKNVNYSEQSKKVSTSKVSFSSLIDNADGHTRYIASTPFPVRGKSAVSSMRVDSARNSDSNVGTVSSSQPLLSYRHHVTRDLRLTDPVTSHMVSERENDEERVADSYTKDGYKVETEEKEKYVNREIEENTTHMSNMYAEEVGKDDSGSLSPNSHAKQCIIS